jgi:hypothetical protein
MRDILKKREITSDSEYIELLEKSLLKYAKQNKELKEKAQEMAETKAYSARHNLNSEER